MKGIYKFYWDCGRMGSLEGIFVTTEAQIANLIGKTIDFGEVLGKHSEISGTLEKDDLKLITRNPEFIELFEQHEMFTGYNPFDYIEEE